MFFFDERWKLVDKSEKSALAVRGLGACVVRLKPGRAELVNLESSHITLEYQRIDHVSVFKLA